MATVLRGVLDVIAREGAPVIPEHRQALDLVDAFAVRGERPTKKAVKTLRDKIAAESARYSVASPDHEQHVYWLAGPFARLLVMLTDGIDDSTELLTQAGYALGGGWAHYSRRIAELRAAAEALHAGLSSEPYVEEPKRVNAKSRADEQAALGASRAALPAWGQAMLDRIDTERDRKLHGTRDQLAAMLARHRYPLHEAAADFEEKFGGMLLRNVGSHDDWRKENLWGLLGPFGCLKLGGDQAVREPDWHQRGMVPVFHGSRDEVGLIDAKGRAWLQLEDEPSLISLGDDAGRFVAALIVYELLFAGEGPWCAGHVRSDRAIGGAIAQALGLPLVVGEEGASRLWASSHAAVLEFQGGLQTLASAFDDDALRSLRRVREDRA
jgi:hypothetical protein